MTTTEQANARATEVFAGFCTLLATDTTLFDRIIADLNQTPAATLGVCFNLCQFLVLKSLHPKEQIEPSSTIDIAWHEFMLHTEAYQQFCATHFNTFIHHRPGSDGHSYERTLELVQTTFGISVSNA
jgi:hypothetical protein